MRILQRLALKCMTGCVLAVSVLNIKARKKIGRLNKETRNSEMLSIPFFGTANGQRSFECRAKPVWNDLKPALKLDASFS